VKRHEGWLTMGLEIFDQEILPDQTNAQILIELTPPDKTFEEAKNIIEGLGVQIIETNRPTPNRVLIKLDVKDMRNIAFILTENGFFKIKGINALDFKNT
jgi:hypothetical protein